MGGIRAAVSRKQAATALKQAKCLTREEETVASCLHFFFLRFKYRHQEDGGPSPPWHARHLPPRAAAVWGSDPTLEAIKTQKAGLECRGECIMSTGMSYLEMKNRHRSCFDGYTSVIGVGPMERSHAVLIFILTLAAYSRLPTRNAYIGVSHAR